MAKTEEIVVDVYPDGSITVDINNVVGKRCTDIVKQLEQRGLGRVTRDQKKAEYNQVERQRNTLSNKH